MDPSFGGDQIKQEPAGDNDATTIAHHQQTVDDINDEMWMDAAATTSDRIIFPTDSFLTEPSTVINPIHDDTIDHQLYEAHWSGARNDGLSQLADEFNADDAVVKKDDSSGGKVKKEEDIMNVASTSGRETKIKKEEEGVVDGDNDDPIAALQAAIEDDKPKYVRSPEWQRMMEAVEQADATGSLTGLTHGPTPSHIEDNNNDGNPHQAAAAALTAGITGADSHTMNADASEENVYAAMRAAVSTQRVRDQEDDVAIDASPARIVQSSGGLESTTTSMSQQQDMEYSAGVDERREYEYDEDDPTGRSAATLQKAPIDIDKEDLEVVRKRTFSVLQPICSVLLTYKSDPEAMSQMLRGLNIVLAESDQQGLQACFLYASFPLLLAVDSIAISRNSTLRASIQQHQQQTEQTSLPPEMQQQQPITLPAMENDAPAEAALTCLFRLLSTCYCPHGEELPSLLQRLSALLELSPLQANEEVRLLAIQCCTATLESIDTLAPQDIVQDARKALTDEATAPVIGHLSALLLKAADQEIVHRPVGSKTIRTAALRCLRALLTAVNSGDALAFFLPGIVTGLSRALHAAVRNVPAVGPEGTVAAVQSLVAILSLTLNDDIVDSTNYNGVHSSSQVASSSANGLEQLQALAAKYSSSSIKSGEGHTTTAKKDEATDDDKAMQSDEKSGSKQEEEEANTRPSSSSSIDKKKSTDDEKSVPFRVERTQNWLDTTCQKVSEILPSVLGPLIGSSNASVREALALGLPKLVSSCSINLQPSRQFLLESILVLAQDQWTQISSPARSFLFEIFSKENHSSNNVGAISIEELLDSLIADLVPKLRAGDITGCEHAQKLSACLQSCNVDWLAVNVLDHPLRRDTLLSTLKAAFRFDQDTLKLLLHAAPETNTAYGYSATTNDIPPANTNTNKESTASASNAAAAPLLPRMPLGLELVGTTATYTALAVGVCRTLSKAGSLLLLNDQNSTPSSSSSMNSSSSNALRALVDGCIRQLHLHLPSNSSRTNSRLKKSKSRSAPHEVLVTGGITTLEDSSIDNTAEGVLSTPWQLDAASVVVLLQEMLFGASSQWTPDWGLRCSTQHASNTQQQNQQESATSSTAINNKELESLVMSVLTELVTENIWRLPTVLSEYSDRALVVPSSSSSYTTTTSAVTSSSSGASNKKGSVQEIGCNVALQRSILELIGSVARGLGPRFASNGAVMRVVLLPLLEKLGDPAPLVASSASAALSSICTHCSFSTGGLRALAEANSDYIVDGICAQLRQPEKYPNAPILLAALLRQSGVASGLLPLLAEPARRALQGISIVSRKLAPHDALPFVMALKEVAGGALIVGREAARCMIQAADSLEAALSATTGDSGVKVNITTDDTNNTTSRVVTTKIEEIIDDDSQDKQQQEEDIVVSQLAASSSKPKSATQQRPLASMEEIQAGFAKTANKKQQEQPDDGTMKIIKLDRATATQIFDSAIDWEDLQVVKKRAKAAATLAQSVADCINPLALHSSLPIAVGALNVCRTTLHALHVTTICFEVYTDRIEPVAAKIGKDVNASGDAAGGKLPKLLPSVHLLWAPLVTALQDWRISVLEAALDTLAEITHLAGGFLRRRFSQEAWSHLQRLLEEGPSKKKVIAPGQDDVATPAVTQRARRAVLICLQTIASSTTSSSKSQQQAPQNKQGLDYDSSLLANRAVTGAEGGSSSVLSTIILPALTSIAPLLSDTTPAAVREDATRAYLSLAALDSDAAWALLVCGARGKGLAAHQLLSLPATVGDDVDGYLPSLEGLCPALSAEQQRDSRVNALSGCGAARVRGLLADVEKKEVGWHLELEGKLDVLAI